jgi:aspartate/methionine/tyrosine aminotransferase
MKIRPFIMESWLAEFKDACLYDLGESGMPDISLGDLLARCGESPDALADIVLSDHDTRGTERLRAAIRATYGNHIPFESITVTTGTSEALFILFMLLTDSRPVVVAPRLSFQALYEVPEALGAEVRYYRVDASTGFVPDPDEIAALIDDRTGCVVLNTPHNPSGVLIPDDVSNAIFATADRHGARIIADEHYRFLPHDSPWPLHSLADPDSPVIATGSITKCFGLIGLRVGWIVCPPEMVRDIRDTRDYLTHTLSPLSDRCAALALEHASAFIDPAVDTLRANRDTLSQLCADTNGLSIVCPEAGVVAFPSYAWDIPTDTFARGLIERHGVFILPGSAFEVEGAFRINLGQSPDRFRDACDLIRTYCDTLGTQ